MTRRTSGSPLGNPPNTKCMNELAGQIEKSNAHAIAIAIAIAITIAIE